MRKALNFPPHFTRFMESELDLNDIIQEMHVIATIPDLYHLLVELHAVQSLLGLLSHENTDILSFQALKTKLEKQVVCMVMVMNISGLFVLSKIGRRRFIDTGENYDSKIAKRKESDQRSIKSSNGLLM